MTITADLKNTLASLKGVKSIIDTFTLHEQTTSTRIQLQTNSKKNSQVISDLEARLAILENEEPEYKGF